MFFRFRASLMLFAVWMQITALEYHYIIKVRNSIRSKLPAGHIAEFILQLVKLQQAEELAHWWGWSCRRHSCFLTAPYALWVRAATKNLLQIARLSAFIISFCSTERKETPGINLVNGDLATSHINRCIWSPVDLFGKGFLLYEITFSLQTQAD